MKKTLIILALILSQSLNAQLSAISGQAAYNFLINLPHDSILNSKPPVLIFLHGKSLSGTDLNKVKKYGVIKEIEKGRNIPAIVVAPQVVSGDWIPEKIASVLDYVQKTYNTDSSRVYVCGMSLGGYGTLNFAGKYNDRIAAAVALCGGGNVMDAGCLATIPVWIQHGDNDTAVPLSESQKIVDAIKAHNEENVVFTVHPGANHADLEKVFRSDELYNWLFSQSKKGL